MIITKGTKELLVNAAANFPLIFTKPGTGADASKEVPATAADATKLRIRGFADYIPLAQLAGSVLAQRAQPEVIGAYTVDSANAAQITVAGGIAAGTSVTISLGIRSTDPLPEYMTNMDKGTYRRTRVYTVVLPAGATALQVLTLLAAQINGRPTIFPEADEPAEAAITASIAAGVLTIAPADAHLSLRLFIEPFDLTSKAAIPVLESVTTTHSYEGRNLYRNLKGGRLQTEGTNSPYAVPGPLELPLAGGKYTRVDFATSTPRPDLSNSAAADSSFATLNKFGVYFKEGGAAEEQAIADLVNFLSRADASVTKFYSDVNQASNAAGTTKTLFLSNAAV